VAGDRLRVAVQSGRVVYSKNGTVYYTSTSAPTYPLFVDTSFVSLNSSIADAVIAGAPSATADVTPPSVSISSPTNGAQVNGVTAITAAASDNVGVTSVQFKLDGVNFGGPLLTGPYTINWDTTSASSGAHTLSADAKDAAGNLASATAVSVTVNNTIADATAPTVSLTAPTAGSTVGGQVTVSANASDNVAVMSVQFKLDGANLGSADTQAPYQVAWDTTAVADGSHVLTAEARDTAGNVGASSGVTITVNNTVSVAISNVTPSSIARTSALISWLTNLPSDSQVQYGRTTAYGSVSTVNATLVSSHAQTLSGLSPNTNYHFRVKSTNGSSTALSADYMFKTSR
jgi:hypothetical protein